MKKRRERLSWSWVLGARVRRFWIVLACGLWAVGAHAADKPTIAPAESWVKPAPPTPIPARSDVAARVLLLDEQVRFEPAGESIFTESRVLIQTPQGLDALGTVALPWKPDTQNLIVHRVSILRGDQVIDLLAGHSFTVLRRETNLEQAMLDGVLTATLQPEGLQVGDVLDIAYTVVETDPVMGGRSEALIAGVSDAPIDHLRVGAEWSKPKTMRWRLSDGWVAPRILHDNETTEVSLDMRAVQPLVPPKDAPTRFAYGREFEFSDFGSWAEVSALFAPLYAKAEVLPSGSPLKAEVAAIRAASTDPKARAALALALVQDKVCYVSLGMNDGGLTPADADTTWTRRFGDCKGKTALLIALLHELGVEAQPALVSTTRGDGLDQRLPTLAFDHILVRAPIGGTVYWLDGTRTGDRDLAQLGVPPFRWALPVQATSANLTALTVPPLDRPGALLSLNLDASAGLDVPAPAKARFVVRGDNATALRLKFGDLAAADLDRALRDFWKKQYAFIEPKSVAASFDPQSGEELMVMDGDATMAWNQTDGSAARRYEIDGASMGWKADFKRDAGPHVDAPFVVDYPTYERNLETISLPRGGAGFAVEGADVDATAAGVNFKRESRIDKGVFTMDASVKSLVPEFPAHEATTAAKTLNDMAGVAVYVRAPVSYVATPADNARQLAANPTTADGFIDRGNALSNLLEYDKAIAEYDKAIALDPKLAVAFGNRGNSRFWKGDLAGAKTDYGMAASLDPRSLVAFHGLGQLAAMDHRFNDAVALYTRAIDQEADDPFALENRARAWMQLGDLDQALADSGEVLRLEPQRSDIHHFRAQIFAIRKAPDREAAELDAARDAAPQDPAVRWMRGEMFANMGRASDARKEMDLAITMNPTAAGYLERARYREKADVTGKEADIDAALKLEPKSWLALSARIQARADAKDYAGAIKELTAALASHADQVEAFLSQRAKIYALSGETTAAIRDFAAVRAKASGHADALNSLCWAQAAIQFALETALQDCSAALKIEPKSALALDSRAFVLMRLGRLDGALADYDAAITLSPYLEESLYGRGLVKLRKGQRTDGQADLEAARARTVRIDEEFAGYGLRP